MRVVDTEVLRILNLVLPPINVGAGLQSRVHDGHVVVDDGDLKRVTYPLPYYVYASNVGSDSKRRLQGRRTRRSVFFAITTVGADRNQVKWAAEKHRAVLADQRLTIPGHNTWPVDLQSSQRVRRDDDAIRPDGSPLFYAIDEYDIGITLHTFEGVPA